jgi:hypothetical protein
MPGEGGPPEIETEQRAVELNGDEWVVRAVGRARVRSGAGGVPLIQIVFRSSDGSEVEALIAGRKLADVPEYRLAEAVLHARPYEPDRAAEPFFQGTRQGPARS